MLAQEQRDGAPRAEPRQERDLPPSPQPVGGLTSPGQNAPGLITANQRHQQDLERKVFKHVLLDQKAIWTSPATLRPRDADWLLPVGGITFGMLRTDAQFLRAPGTASDYRRYRQLADYGLAGSMGVVGATYALGLIKKDSHLRETGWLAGQAAVNTAIVTQVLKLSTGRDRPLHGQRTGAFGVGGNSFPSMHSALSWSMASVMAHEYRGPLTKFAAYGLASAVSAAQVKGRRHFPSDVFVGATLGWLVGRATYRRHHNPALEGADIPSRHEPQSEISRPRASVYVPLDSWIYPSFDRLAALGCIRSHSTVIRPWARKEFTRLLEEVDESCDASGLDQVPELLRDLRQEFAQESSADPRVEVESVYARVTGIAGEELSDSYNFGQTIANDMGRPNRQGGNLILGGSGWATAGAAGGYVRVEFQRAPARDLLPLAARQAIADRLFIPIRSAPIGGVDEVRLLDGYFVYNLKDVQFSFGKQSLWWGMGRTDSLVVSDNAEPIPMLRITRVTPTRLPLLGWLGPFRADLFIGRLAGHEFMVTQNGLRPATAQPFIHGQTFSFKPTPNFEFSFSRTTMMGGTDFPLTFRTFARSFFATENRFGARDPGDRRSGLHLQYRVPRLRDRVTVYADGMAEDEPSPLVFPHRSAWLGGVYLSRIPRVPKADLRVEGTFTDLPHGTLFPGFFYFNVRYRDGYTNRGNLLAGWVGRQGQGVQVASRYWFSPKKTLDAVYRHRSVNRELLQGGSVDAGSLKSIWRTDSGTSFSGMLQFERWHFPVIHPLPRNNWTAAVEVQHRFRIK